MTPPPAASLAEPDAIAHALLALADDRRRERVRVADVFAALQDQALAALILLFALPNTVPVPPGTSGVLGVPLLFLTAQLALGLPAWLPSPLSSRSLPRESFARGVQRLLPWLQRARPLLQPRWLPLLGPLPLRLVGLLCLALAVVLALPVPLGNMAPAAAISLMMLGVLRHDGAWLLAGALLGLVALAVAGTVVHGALLALHAA